MILVEYLFGVVDLVYCYYVDVFVYVVEGLIVMQVKGGEFVMLKLGQIFYEGLNDLYMVGCNVSWMWFVKFIVLLLKDKGVFVFVLEK